MEGYVNITKVRVGSLVDGLKMEGLIVKWRGLKWQGSLYMFKKRDKLHGRSVTMQLPNSTI